MITANKATFCSAAWFNVRNENNGTLKSCTCIKSDESYNINNCTIEEWRNSSSMLRLREEHANGNKPKSCQRCWDLEALGLESQRMQYNRIVNLDWANVYFNYYPGTYKTHLTIASDLKIGNKCNLECAMCSPEYSSKIAKTWKDKPSLEFTTVMNSKDYQNTLLMKFMDELFEHPIKFVNVLGGEPLLEKRLTNKLLSLKNKHKINLNFITNGTFNLKEYSAKLKDFKSLHFAVSVDGIGDVNDYIRKGSDWATIKNNILNNDVHLIATVQALNIHHLHELEDFANNNNIEVQYISVFDPDYMSLDAVPPEELQRVKTNSKTVQTLINNANYKPALREKHLRYIKWYTQKSPN